MGRPEAAPGSPGAPLPAPPAALRAGPQAKARTRPRGSGGEFAAVSAWERPGPEPPVAAGAGSLRPVPVRRPADRGERRRGCPVVAGALFLRG